MTEKGTDQTPEEIFELSDTDCDVAFEFDNFAEAFLAYKADTSDEFGEQRRSQFRPWQVSAPEIQPGEIEHLVERINMGKKLGPEADNLRCLPFLGMDKEKSLFGLKISAGKRDALDGMQEMIEIQNFLYGDTEVFHSFPHVNELIKAILFYLNGKKRQPVNREILQEALSMLSVMQSDSLVDTVFEEEYDDQRTQNFLQLSREAAIVQKETFRDWLINFNPTNKAYIALLNKIKGRVRQDLMMRTESTLRSIAKYCDIQPPSANPVLEIFKEVEMGVNSVIGNAQKEQNEETVKKEPEKTPPPTEVSGAREFSDFIRQLRSGGLIFRTGHFSEICLLIFHDDLDWVDEKGIDWDQIPHLGISTVFKGKENPDEVLGDFLLKIKSWKAYLQRHNLLTPETRAQFVKYLMSIK